MGGAIVTGLYFARPNRLAATRAGSGDSIWPDCFQDPGDLPMCMDSLNFAAMNELPNALRWLLSRYRSRFSYFCAAERDVAKVRQGVEHLHRPVLQHQVRNDITVICLSLHHLRSRHAARSSNAAPAERQGASVHTALWIEIELWHVNEDHNLFASVFETRDRQGEALLEDLGLRQLPFPLKRLQDPT